MAGNNPPLVSVCIPAYNHERYITACIDSIIRQTYPNIELIVVDDGSNDKTWDTVCALKDGCTKRFKRVVFEHQENQGTCRTLNRLLSLAQGRYFYLIASDDMSQPSAIADLVAFLEENPAYVLCVGDNEIIDAAGHKIAWDNKRRSVPFEQGYQTFASYLQSKKNVPDFQSDEFGTYQTLARKNYIVNGYLVRKEVIDKIGGWTPQAPLEDWYLMLQLAKYGRFRFLNKILFSYRWHDTNTTKNRTRMEQFQRKTLLHEKQLLVEKYPHLLPAFTDAMCKKKVWINRPPVLMLYKEKNLYHKRIRLVLCGVPLTLYKKTLKK